MGIVEVEATEDVSNGNLLSNRRMYNTIENMHHKYFNRKQTNKCGIISAVRDTLDARSL